MTGTVFQKTISRELGEIHALILELFRKQADRTISTKEAKLLNSLVNWQAIQVQKKERTKRMLGGKAHDFLGQSTVEKAIERRKRKLQKLGKRKLIL